MIEKSGGKRRGSKRNTDTPAAQSNETHTDPADPTAPVEGVTYVTYMSADELLYELTRGAAGTKPSGKPVPNTGGPLRPRTPAAPARRRTNKQTQTKKQPQEEGGQG